MSPAADRWDDYLERGAALDDAHEAGEHAEPETDCARCQREMREAPDPSWTEADGYVVAPLENRGAA